MKVTTSAEMREIDRVTSERYGVPSLMLMENAGTHVAEYVLRRYPHAERIWVVCGKGNNGGDGFVAARKLHEAGKKVSVLLLGDPADVKGDAAVMLKQLPIPPTVIRTEKDFTQVAPPLSRPGLAHEDGPPLSRPGLARQGGEVPNDDEVAPPLSRPSLARQGGVVPVGVLSGCDLILDAILGTGFKPPVTGLFAAAIELINNPEGAPRLPGFGKRGSVPARGEVPVIAVDIPSGANADAFAPQPEVAPPLSRAAGQGGCVRCRADAIVTFTAPRPAHVFADLTRGEIVVGQIGSPPEAIQSALNLDVVAWPDISSCFALRAPDAHKGSFGHVLTIGGSLGKSGAAAMAGMAALRAGAGLSTVATPRSVLPMVAGFAAELMTEPLAETEAGTISLAATEYGRLDAIVNGKTVLALGPGISRQADTVQFIRAMVSKYPQPLVIDADGLNAFEGHAEMLDGSARPLVLTPHPGEMARLTGLSTKQIQQDRIGAARSFARDHHCVVVLKGHRTLIAEPDGHVWVNMSGNPGMATGGTGDVLTGLIAGMIAQFPNHLVGAVCAAVWVHGYAGDRAATWLSEQAMTATDVLDYAYIDRYFASKIASHPVVTIQGIADAIRD